jgi:hypothetical protein
MPRIAQYNFKKVEKRWKDFWDQRGFFKVDTYNPGKKFYYLNMFPYPSGGAPRRPREKLYPRRRHRPLLEDAWLHRPQPYGV